MTTYDQRQSYAAPRGARLAAILLVLALHVLLVIFLALQRGVLPPPPQMSLIDLSLAPPFGGGGGGEVSERVGDSPASPLALNRPPEPQPRPDSPPLSPEAPPSPAAPLTASVSETPAVETATQGGVGAGTGTGAGVGDGPGTGSGSGSGMGDGAGRSVGHQLIQGPANAVVTQGVAIGQIAAGAERYAVLTCRIGLNERLQGCRLAREHPLGDGAGRDAMVRAREFRIRPPIRNGVYVDGQPVTIAVILPPRADRRRGIRR